MNARQRERHNARARRKMDLANLEGNELDEWLARAGGTLMEGTEGTFALLRSLRSVISMTTPDMSELDREVEMWTAELQKSIDDLSILGPNGRPVPFGLVQDPLEMDAALEHSLEIKELIVANATERFGDLEKALSPFASDEEVGKTLRQVGEVRARLAQLAMKLRAAIEL